MPVRQRAMFSRRADIGWENHTFKSHSIFGSRWHRKCLPRLEIDKEFIAVGVGADMYIHWIKNVGMFDKTQPSRELQWTVYNLGRHGAQDVTEIIPLGVKNEFIVGQANGSIRHLLFSLDDATYSVKRVFQHPRAIIRSLSTTKDYLVALASTSSNAHLISFYSLAQKEDGSISDGEVSPIHMESSPRTESWIPTRPTQDVVHPDFTTDYPTRPWQALFVSPTQLALGSTSPDALSIQDFHPESAHPLTRSRQLFSHPARIANLVDQANEPSKTAIYAMLQYSTHMLLSGWYHGPANLHDLRSSSEYPALQMDDPLDDGAAYSLATDGCHRILVGGANHGLIKIFDVRMPREGWSIYLGRERCPIYDLKAEHSRIFAATEGTVWECDLSWKHKPRRFDSDWSWRAPGRNSHGRWTWGGRSPEEERSGGAQVRLHYGAQKLYREDGSEIGKATTRGVALS
jgi:hypothetical protein